METARSFFFFVFFLLVLTCRKSFGLVTINSLLFPSVMNLFEIAKFSALKKVGDISVLL